jgi:hypothetical protein
MVLTRDFDVLVDFSFNKKLMFYSSFLLFYVSISIFICYEQPSHSNVR